MKIAVASGKGGTGKTSVSSLLASFLAKECGEKIKYLDCDCEAPNAHIFFKAPLEFYKAVEIRTPAIDTEKCTFCGLCREICRFNAITIIGAHVAMTFEELCHGCGGCFRVCEAGAIEDKPRLIGEIYRTADRKAEIELIQGRLRIGEAMSPPLIKGVLEALDESDMNEGRTAIIDCPPGTSCPVVTSIKCADMVLIVAEPTPFGLHDAEILAKVVQQMGLPFGVVANKVTACARNAVEEWCRSNGHKYIGGLPFSTEMLREYAKGGDIFGIARKSQETMEVFWRIARMLQKK